MKRTASETDSVLSVPGRNPNNAGDTRPSIGGKQLMNGRPSPRTTNTGGKRTPNTGGKQLSTGPEPVTNTNPGTGGKHIDSPKPGTGGKQATTTGGKHTTAPGQGGKQPYPVPPIKHANTPPPASSRSPNVRPSNQTARPPGVGGKESVRITTPDTKNTKRQPPVYQPASSLAPVRTGSKPKSRAGATKQHPLVGKTVKVWYVPEGYYTGIVKEALDGNEFMIHWLNDGSTSPATLNEGDETDDAENEDRWSVVEDSYESMPKAQGNGARKYRNIQKNPPSYEEEDNDNENDNDVDNEDT